MNDIKTWFSPFFLLHRATRHTHKKSTFFKKKIIKDRKISIFSANFQSKIAQVDITLSKTNTLLIESFRVNYFVLELVSVA